jgi:hypothetical protein
LKIKIHDSLFNLEIQIKLGEMAKSPISVESYLQAQVKDEKIKMPLVPSTIKTIKLG